MKPQPKHYSLFDGRHPLPDNLGAIAQQFDFVNKQVSKSDLWDQAVQDSRLGVFLYVTGLTPALIQFLNDVKSVQGNVVLLHYDNASGSYWQQLVAFGDSYVFGYDADLVDPSDPYRISNKHNGSCADQQVAIDAAKANGTKVVCVGKIQARKKAKYANQHFVVQGFQSADDVDASDRRMAAYMAKQPGNSGWSVDRDDTHSCGL